MKTLLLAAQKLKIIVSCLCSYINYKDILPNGKRKCYRLILFVDAKYLSTTDKKTQHKKYNAFVNCMALCSEYHSLSTGMMDRTLMFCFYTSGGNITSRNHILSPKLQSKYVNYQIYLFRKVQHQFLAPNKDTHKSNAFCKLFYYSSRESAITSL